MSVYNGGPYLREAVDSVLAQTFADFEFIIINDGSTDRSREVLESYTDPRVRLIHQQNVGLTKSLNRGIALARGEYVARMDADDISLPRRLEKQVALLDARQDVAVVSSPVWVLRADGAVLKRPGLDGEDLPLAISIRNVVGSHGLVMVRRSRLLDVGGYDESMRYAQDYDLWVRMLRAGARFAMVDEPLYVWRDVPTSISRARAAEQEACRAEVQARAAAGLPKVAAGYPPERIVELVGLLLEDSYTLQQKGMISVSRRLAATCVTLRPFSAAAYKRLMATAPGISLLWHLLRRPAAGESGGNGQ